MTRKPGEEACAHEVLEVQVPQGVAARREMLVARVWEYG